MRWDDRSDCGGSEWRLRPLKLRLKGDNNCGAMEEGGGLAPGEGGSHGGPGVASRRHEAGDGDCLASNGGRG
jgi:hypothetical protein